MTLGEKIEKNLEKIKKTKIISLIDDAFYREETERGNTFYVRRTDLQRGDGRTRDVPDEIELKIQAEIEQAEIAAKKDMTFEEFKAKFEDHIEGRAEQTRILADSDDDVAVDPKATIASRGSKSRSKNDRTRGGSQFDAASNKSGERGNFKDS